MNPLLLPKMGETFAVRNTGRILTRRKNGGRRGPRSKGSKRFARNDLRSAPWPSTSSVLKTLRVFPPPRSPRRTARGEPVPIARRCNSSDCPGAQPADDRHFHIVRECIAQSFAYCVPVGGSRLNAGGWHIDQHDGGVGQQGPARENLAAKWRSRRPLRSPRCNSCARRRSFAQPRRLRTVA